MLKEQDELDDVILALHRGAHVGLVEISPEQRPRGCDVSDPRGRRQMKWGIWGLNIVAAAHGCKG